MLAIPGLNLNLERDPHAPACLEAGRVVSRDQLRRWVDALRSALRGCQVGAGDVVAVCLPGHGKHLALQVALFELGAVMLGMPVQQPPAERLSRLRLQPTRLVVVETAQEATALRQAEIPVRTLQELLDSASGLEVAVVAGQGLAPDLACRMEWRAGPDGQAVCEGVTQGLWRDKVQELQQQCDGESRLLSGPLNHLLPAALAFAVLAAGGVVVFGRARTPQAWLELVQLHAISHAILDAAHLQALLSVVPSQGRALPSMRCLRLVGKGVNRARLDQAIARLTPNVVAAGWESVLGVAASPADLAEASTGPMLQLDGISVSRHAQKSRGPESEPCAPQEWLDGVNARRWLH